ncbi:HAMP domain-containing histidine kinase [Ruminococcaceae bacterium OttesenSCG-928-A16]|nr:HAMP domain-containing histidine kinase [Ruminococcaceae bacterium OttesenSCG-928-A16]
MKTEPNRLQQKQVQQLLAKKVAIAASVFTVGMVFAFFISLYLDYRTYIYGTGKNGTYNANMVVPFNTLLAIFAFLYLAGLTLIVLYYFNKIKKMPADDLQKLLQGQRRNSKELSLQKTIQRRYLRNFFVSFAIYTVVLLGVMLVGLFIKDLFVWYTDEPFFWLLRLARDFYFVFFIFIWAVGVVWLIFRQWRACSADIMGLVKTIEAMVAQPEEKIDVPKNLTELQPVLQEVQYNTLASQREAKEAEQRKNDLIVYLAHDLKTPLTSVIGYLGLLQDEPDITPETRQRYTQIAAAKAERLEMLTNEFFEITRFNLQGLVLQPARLNFSRMVQQLCYEFEPVFAPKGLTTQLEIQPDIELLADAGKLERVLDNLLRNAASYSYNNTIITVKATLQNGLVTVQIANKGATIPPYKLGHVFEQFYRVDTSRSTQEGGSGLGLAIAKEIVELHQGSIAVQSQNEETIFTVELPTGLQE